jgi:4-hydroxybenzoate polyprenyltransferase
MKLIKAFFRLIRWPNLVFIVLTQCLFYYCIILPGFSASPVVPISPHIFILIVAASVCIAAGGYIINDYFDINIDQINKPDKMVVEKLVKRRWAIFFHLVITTAGVVCSFFAALQTSLIIFIVNIFCTLLLWFYSTTFKKKLLSGNIIISLLTAWVILVLYFACNPFFIVNDVDKITSTLMQRIFKPTILYAGFAFIISLIREVIKDMEDMQGDAKYNCKTMPIVWGVPATKVFVAVWLIVLVSTLSIVQFYVLQFGWWASTLYCFVLIIFPLILILKKLYDATVATDYHRLSTLVKLVMFTGILSMFFFKYYAL